MRNFLTFLCALVLLSSCASNRNTTSQNLDPDKGKSERQIRDEITGQLSLFDDEDL